MTDPITRKWFLDVVDRYNDAVARGLHDDECEFLPNGFFLCHCHKRARLAKGHTEPPGELIYNYPTCPRCYGEVDHDGDSFVCDECHVTWSPSDTSDPGTFDDDYGDITADRQKWIERHDESV